MAATADLLATIDPGLPPPQSVRQTGVPPWRMATTRDALPATLAEVTSAEARSEGRLAVIVPDTQVAELGHAISRAGPGASFGAGPAPRPSARRASRPASAERMRGSRAAPAGRIAARSRARR